MKASDGAGRGQRLILGRIAEGVLDVLANADAVKMLKGTLVVDLLIVQKGAVAAAVVDQSEGGLVVLADTGVLATDIGDVLDDAMAGGRAPNQVQRMGKVNRLVCTISNQVSHRRVSPGFHQVRNNVAQTLEK